MIAFLITMAANLFISHIPYGEYDDALYQKTVQVIVGCAEEIESRLSLVENLTYNIIADPSVQHNLTVLSGNQEVSAEWIAASRNMESLVNSYVYANADVLDILLMTDGTYFQSGTQYWDPESRVLFQQAATDVGAKPTWVLRNESVVCCRTIRESADLSLRTLGVVALKVNFSSLVGGVIAGYRQTNTPISMSIYDGDTCIYGAQADLPAEDSSRTGWFVTGNRLIVSDTFGGRGWQYVMAVQYEDIFRDIRTAVLLSSLISCAVMLLAMAGCALSTSDLLKPINRLLENFDAFGKGRYVVNEQQADRKRKDEIGLLYRHFDHMVASHERYEQEAKEKQKLLQDSQMRQLRQQLQPHFLFNTLNMIQWQAHAREQKEIATITEALGSMLRRSLKYKDLITVQEDLRMVDDYLTIQSMRYTSRLQVERQIDPRVLPLRIPCMTLQPIVENSIIHGLEEMLEPCQIRIYTVVGESTAELIVEDNGPGMSADTASGLIQGENPGNGIGIGLSNISKRLRLVYPGCGGLRLEALAPGTRVIVTIPLERSEQPCISC